MRHDDLFECLKNGKIIVASPDRGMSTDEFSKAAGKAYMSAIEELGMPTIYYFDEVFNMIDQNFIETAKEFWDEGILKPPNPHCMFVYPDTALSVVEDELGFRATSFIWIYPTTDKAEFLPGEGFEALQFTIGKIPELGINSAMVATSGIVTRWQYGSSVYFHEHLQDMGGGPLGNQLSDEGHNFITDMFQTLLSCCLILNNKQFVKKENYVSPKLNKKRIKNGKVPLVDYTTISLTPINENVKTNGIQGTHASPRPHWRRGHVRKYKSGRKTWIDPILVNWEGGALPNKIYKIKK